MAQKKKLFCYRRVNAWLCFCDAVGRKSYARRTNGWSSNYHHRTGNSIRAWCACTGNVPDLMGGHALEQKPPLVHVQRQVLTQSEDIPIITCKKRKKTQFREIVSELQQALTENPEVTLEGSVHDLDDAAMLLKRKIIIRSLIPVLCCSI